MNILDTHLKDMKVKGEKERVVNGITIEIYEPSEKEKFLSIGRGLEMKRIMEEERNKKFMERPVAITQEQKIQKAALVKRFEQDFGPDAYLNLSQGK